MTDLFPPFEPDKEPETKRFRAVPNGDCGRDGDCPNWRRCPKNLVQYDL